MVFLIVFSSELFIAAILAMAVFSFRYSDTAEKINKNIVSSVPLKLQTKNCFH